jgi:hypothetical protein
MRERSKRIRRDDRHHNYRRLRGNRPRAGERQRPLESERTAQGGYFVWLDESVVNNLERLRGPRDEDLGAVIVRLFGEQANEQIAELIGSEQVPSERDCE